MKNNKSKGGNKKKDQSAKGNGITHDNNWDCPLISLQHGDGKDKQNVEAGEGNHEKVTQQEDQKKPCSDHQTADNNFEGAKIINGSSSSLCQPMEVAPSGKKVEYPQKESNRKKAQKGKTIIKKGVAASGDMNRQSEKQSNNNKKRNKPSTGGNGKRGVEKEMQEEEKNKTKEQSACVEAPPIKEQPIIGKGIAQIREEEDAAIISPDHQILESELKSEAGKECEDPHGDTENASGMKINIYKKRKIRKKGEVDGESGTSEKNETSNQRERKDNQGITSQPDTINDERKDPLETTSLIEKKQKKTASKSEAGNKPKGAKISLSEEETKEKIYKYMKQMNRPYSVINVYDNLHGTISKNVVQKLMDELSTEEKLQCKEYGKAKVYLVNQGEFKSLNMEEMEKLKKDMEIMREQTEIAKNDFNHFVKIKKKVIQDLELVENADKYNEEFHLVEEEIKMYEETNKACKLTTDEIDLIKKKHGYLHAMWLKRKNLCVEIIKCIATLTDKDTKGIIFHLGIDVDEDVVPPNLYF
ncbi:Tat binding protein 1(TBP-1)-interacting protein, putative [Plasmodium knowlesi strain H]|uniref:Tat binding protein 1(TBP-1)-interacting protein, putative n=3 Tax=Plasmodium knowlesi TaxID=5850 RepID=A0A1A7W304_PLAKH|nr:Tat binding protein 1(TBP-1)-interacting protein, putative [Plasmodium knowlesi strain H]OTN66645.1 putative Tat binding protein 1(TBP-1)-interacting protein [Plasmodium knowlesi]CAA9990104.1 Tat binding protein 1(TBP-1)-interacting protein, putative [Plasmodium knowlesi strain H]SBO25779.1 Tat binding protein 1(TBP-1)-interacting protein, putative [Plasmodium knowlesi strain H]SBO28576.1 Tat binding protein 1(TBP-1)-interacting protein, putative [Plasmodium knowlesi strain H]VVS79578.1 Tat